MRQRHTCDHRLLCPQGLQPLADEKQLLFRTNVLPVQAGQQTGLRIVRRDKMGPSQKPPHGLPVGVVKIHIVGAVVGHNRIQQHLRPRVQAEKFPYTLHHLQGSQITHKNMGEFHAVFFQMKRAPPGKIGQFLHHRPAKPSGMGGKNHRRHRAGLDSQHRQHRKNIRHRSLSHTAEIMDDCSPRHRFFLRFHGFHSFLYSRQPFVPWLNRQKDSRQTACCHKIQTSYSASLKDAASLQDIYQICPLRQSPDLPLRDPP